MSTYSGYHADCDLSSLIISPFGPSDDYSQIPIGESFTRRGSNINKSDGTTCKSGITNSSRKEVVINRKNNNNNNNNNTNIDSSTTKQLQQHSKLNKNAKTFEPSPQSRSSLRTRPTSGKSAKLSSKSNLINTAKQVPPSHRSISTTPTPLLQLQTSKSMTPQQPMNSHNNVNTQNQHNISKQKASISRNNRQKKRKSKSAVPNKVQKSNSMSVPNPPAAFGITITTKTQLPSQFKHPKLKKHGRWDFIEGQKIRKYTASKMDIWIDSKNTRKWYSRIQGFDDASELYYWLNFGTGLCLMKQYGSTRKFSLSQSKSIKDERACTVRSDDIFSDHTVTASGHQSRIEFVIINYEIIHIQTWKTLYGVIELNKPHGQYKHQLTQLLTSQQIKEKYGINKKDLPEATRDSQKFKRTLKMDKNKKLTFESLMGMNMKYKFASKKKGIYDTHFVQETKVIEKYLDKWRIKAIEKQKEVKVQYLVPLLFINSQRGEHRTDWAYFVRIIPFGYDVAMVFRFKHDRFEFKRVLLDVEEVTTVHHLLGRQNIHEMEQGFEVPTGYYEELLASKRPRSQQMHKTIACLQFDEELKEKEVVKDVDGVQQKLEMAQKELKHKERIIGKLLNEKKEREVMKEQQHEIKKRKSVRLMVPVEQKKDEDDEYKMEKAKKNQRKKLKQKLKDIEKLEIKQKAGDKLLPQQIEKINRKREYKARLKSLLDEVSGIAGASVAEAGAPRSHSDKAMMIVNKFKSMEKKLMHKNHENDKLKAINKKLNASRHLILSQNECLKQRLERYLESDGKQGMRKNNIMHESENRENVYLRQKMEQFEYQFQTMEKDGEMLRKENGKLKRENERLRGNRDGNMERELMRKQQIIEELRFENNAYQKLGDKILKEQKEQYEEKQVVMVRENKMVRKENKNLKMEVDRLKSELASYKQEMNKLKYRMSVPISSPLVSLQSLERVLDQCEVEVEMEKGKEWKCIED